MRTIESILPNEVIHCPTEREAQGFCKLLHEAGEFWCDGNSYFNESNWLSYQNNTCYHVINGEYGRKTWYEENIPNCIVTNVTEFLNMKNENQKIPHEGMEAIYNVACDAWKQKIRKMTSVFGDTELTNEQVQEMYAASSESQKEVLKKWIQLPKSKIDNITCFKDIEAALGEKVVLPYTNPKTKEERQLNATVKGFAVAKVFNEGKILTWENREDYKYFPYKYFSGGFWVWFSCYCYRVNGYVPVGLCFKNSDLSTKAHTLFPEIYEDILMFEKV